MGRNNSKNTHTFSILGVPEERLDTLLKSLQKESVTNINLMDDNNSVLSSSTNKTDGGEFMLYLHVISSTSGGCPLVIKYCSCEVSQVSCSLSSPWEVSNLEISFFIVLTGYKYLAPAS